MRPDPRCSPSRNSFLSGRTPDAAQVWNFRDSFRRAATGAPGPGANWTTMPGYFLGAGYYATASGKVFHDCCGTGAASHFDYPRSWSDVPVLQTKFPCAPTTGGYTMSCPFNRSAGDADADAETTDLVISRLEAWAAKGSVGTRHPFFAAAGLQGTRLPWAYPVEVPAARYPAGAAPCRLVLSQ
jgi:iduronate 2-sulfatase